MTTEDDSLTPVAIASRRAEDLFQRLDSVGCLATLEAIREPRRLVGALADALVVLEKEMAT